MVVYHGTGGLLVLIFLCALFLFNFDIFLDYDRTKFLIQWWPACFISAIGALWLARHSDKMNRMATPSTYLGRVFLFSGSRHTIYWIPLHYWSYLFTGLGVWQILDLFYINK